MRPSFYYNGHYLDVANHVKEFINSSDDFLTERVANSTRAVGDAIENLLAERFDTFLGDWCDEYSNEFARRAMADFAFSDKEGFHSILDVKTHRNGTNFNMPNLTSVDRLTRFYESDSNIFALVLIKYSVDEMKVNVTDVIFAPIEFLSWDCLTIGALGWGQIQISNSNNIVLINGNSRKDWMLTLCDTLLEFYPKEIDKINSRKNRFIEERDKWESRDDIWRK